MEFNNYLGDNIKIKEIPKEERPRERLYLYGKESLANEELLAIILKTGTKNRSAKVLALDLLKLIDEYSIENLSFSNLTQIKGIGKVKAIEFLAIIEFCRRLNNLKPKTKKIIRNSNDAFLYMKTYLVDYQQECFYAIYLNPKNEVIEHRLLFKGTINQSLVHPREIFKYAYLLSATSIICLHNHPSGNPEPSKEDIRLIKALEEISKLQQINILDHLIITKDRYYSYYDK